VTHPHKMTDAAAVRGFVLAGDARLTLVSRKTGARFTYRVRAADGAGPASHFVSVLTGPENTTDYSYFGHFFKDGRVGTPDATPLAARFVHGRKSKIGDDAPSTKAWRWFCQQIDAGRIPAELECWHEGRCAVCSRVLTTPESLKRGIGPECAGKLGMP
jgi:hypothetical protein